MYKIKLISVVLTLAVILLLPINIKAQPDYLVTAKNDVLVNDFIYEFEIYVLRVGTTPLELASLQVSIYFNDAIRNGGNLTGQYILGTSGLSNSSQYPFSPNLSFTKTSGTIRQIRISSQIPPGAGNGSLISNISPGTCLGRFRITNTVAFSKTLPVGWQWNFVGGTGEYVSYINAYVGSINTNITSQSNFEINLHDPLASAAAFQMSVFIQDGWNMTSIPGLHPVNQNVNTWWINRDPAAGVFKFSGGYQSVTALESGTGYWMKHLGNQLYNTGDEWPASGILFVPHNPINANSGWNLIGGYEYNASASGITTNPPGLTEGSVFGYSGGYQPVSELIPGYGYWIKLSGAGQIILPPPTLKVTPPQAEKTDKNINEIWGKIIITDAAGRSYTLYAVNPADGVNEDSPNGGTGVNLNNYDLPPSPPSGMFDVRFGSGRFAEDLKSAVQSIEMMGIEYPIKIKAENINIKLHDESGKQINVRLNSGEDILIYENNINRLFVSEDVIPENYYLEQNYPNPFNPTTKIRYQIPEDGIVTLKIYDILGKEVKTLVNEPKTTGRYEIKFDASDLTSGVYIYRIQVNDYISSKKMLMIK